MIRVSTRAGATRRPRRRAFSTTWPTHAPAGCSPPAREYARRPDDGMTREESASIGSSARRHAPHGGPPPPRAGSAPPAPPGLIPETPMTNAKPAGPSCRPGRTRRPATAPHGSRRQPLAASGPPAAQNVPAAGRLHAPSEPVLALSLQNVWPECRFHAVPPVRVLCST